VSVDTQRFLDALSSPVRREILWLVWERELAAGEIVDAFELRAATISEHLAALRNAGLLTMRVDGTFRRYVANRDAVAGLRTVLRDEEQKWFPGTTPAPLSPAHTVGVVVVETDAPCDITTAFRAFTDAGIYSRWAGIAVSLVDGRFSAEMEWGLKVRGIYEHVIEPSLIVMNWDFASDQVPVPGASQRAYLHLTALSQGCRLQLHQLVSSEQQARFMERAWGVMLARFRDGVTAALDPTVAMPMRPKRRRAI
jgi:DNA-binding transcriptional ArsR family regulator/uncharacterized protein YndB with AHSA1/START domain